MKPVYVPTVAETVLPADRPTAWVALAGLVGIDRLGGTRARSIGGHEMSERAISFEAPWRLVLDAADPPTTFHQESIVLVPDDAGCLAMWSALVLEPVDDRSRHYAAAVAEQVPESLDRLVRILR